MEQLDLAEADGSQQVQLIGDGAGRVLGEDPFVQLLAKRFSAGSRQVFAVSPPMNGLKFWERAFDNIENPKRAARPQGIMQCLKDRLPLVISPQVVQHCGSEHDVEACLSKINVTNVGANCFHRTRGLGTNSGNGQMEHRLGEINQRDAQVRQSLQLFQGVVPTAAADFEQLRGVGRRDCRRAAPTAFLPDRGLGSTSADEAVGVFLITAI